MADFPTAKKDPWRREQESVDRGNGIYGEKAQGSLEQKVIIIGAGECSRLPRHETTPRM